MVRAGAEPRTLLFPRTPEVPAEHPRRDPGTGKSKLPLLQACANGRVRVRGFAGHWFVGAWRISPWRHVVPRGWLMRVLFSLPFMPASTSLRCSVVSPRNSREPTWAQCRALPAASRAAVWVPGVCRWFLRPLPQPRRSPGKCSDWRKSASRLALPLAG